MSFRVQAPDEAEDSQDASDYDRRKAETSAALRTLETNLILLLSFVLLFALYNLTMSAAHKVVIMSVYKGVIPITTTVANFGKIRNVLSVYFRNVARRVKPSNIQDI
jgi:hypothetical protein